MNNPARTTARTEDKPVLKDAQWMLTKENPLLDWSRLMSLDSLVTLLSMVRLESSSHVDRRGGCSGISPAHKIFFDHALLVVLVDEVLAVAEQTEGSHFGEEDEGEAKKVFVAQQCSLLTEVGESVSNPEEMKKGELTM